MPDPQDAQQALEALALTGATAVVTAMATDSWQAIRARTLELFRRHRPSRGTAGIEADLDGAGAAQRAAAPAAARQTLVGS
jgi:hypothetical protein